MAVRKQLSQTMRLPSLTKRHHNTQPSPPNIVKHKQTPVQEQPKQQQSEQQQPPRIPAEERITLLRPTSKKRALSRGHHGNIPHPSPVYHCPFAGQPGSSTDHSEHHQQSQQPRATSSIPVFRDISPVGDLLLMPAGSNGATPRQHQHRLRHQSTLPEMGGRSSTMRKGSSASTATTPATFAGTLLPVLPPPMARLASTGSYDLGGSPANTLVYDQSPATTGYRGGGRRQAGRIMGASQATTPGDIAPMFVPSIGDTNGLSVPQSQSQSQSQSQKHHYSARQRDDAASSEGKPPSQGWQLKSRILQPISTWFKSSRQHTPQNSQQQTMAEKIAMADSGMVCGASPKYIDSATTIHGHHSSAS
ncbi:hypothetical protein EC988_002344 [Linderina pennispora]|nr:hypothetical protein EC988_002344 [Linderina pennispora]